jgi:hypothetical protein
MWFALSRETAHAFRVYFPDLHWVLRCEDGEITGRAHLHFLLGDPINHTTISQRFAMMSRWEGLGGGMARCRVYEPRLAGVDYVCKCLGGESSGANVYELGKFGSAAELRVSAAAQAALDNLGQDVIVGRTRPETAERGTPRRTLPNFERVLAMRRRAVKSVRAA